MAHHLHVGVERLGGQGVAPEDRVCVLAKLDLVGDELGQVSHGASLGFKDVQQSGSSFLQLIAHNTQGGQNQEAVIGEHLQEAVVGTIGKNQVFRKSKQK